jgi:hypothetical protein
MPVLAELACGGCGRKTYHPVGERIEPCPVCGAEQRVVDTFRDRRRVSVPVKGDRRKRDG